MNKLVYLIVSGASLLACAACVHSKLAILGAGHPVFHETTVTHTPVVTDPFRINMTTSYGSSYPATPTPPPNPCGQQYWFDVWDWQDFLYNTGFAGILYGTYPDCPNTGTFDHNTFLATKAFQASSLGGPPVQINGKVDVNTYNKARNVGSPYLPMKPYPTPPWH